MSNGDDPRAAYWNDTYRKYWQDRVAEAKDANPSSVQPGDAKTEGDWVYERVFDAHPFCAGKLLDVGCAWGRMFPIYFERGQTVSGVDISDAMIELARNSYDTHPNVDSIQVATAEKLPYPDAHFDNVVCVAVFDATYQNVALAEFLRVLKPKGRLYLTGKSDEYRADDELALVAEKAARAKGHPNYFTDLPKMRSTLKEAGCKEIAVFGFERRGDFSEFVYKDQLSPPVYEWFMVIEGPSVHQRHSFPELSAAFSRTFMNTESAE